MSEFKFEVGDKVKIVANHSFWSSLSEYVSMGMETTVIENISREGRHTSIIPVAFGNEVMTSIIDERNGNNIGFFESELEKI